MHELTAVMLDYTQQRCISLHCKRPLSVTVASPCIAAVLALTSGDLQHVIFLPTVTVRCADAAND